MSVEVETIDCAALTEAQLEDMVAMGGSFDMERLVKAKEDWVLCTTSIEAGKVQGFTFSTLERIGGTPCVLLGLMSVKRSSKRDAILKGLMSEAFHRALMAFPDEDVVVGSRFVSAEGLEAFKQLTELIPRPGHRAVGEEPVWRHRAEQLALDLVSAGEGPVLGVRRVRREVLDRSHHLDRDLGLLEGRVKFESVAQFPEVARDGGSVVADAGDEAEAGDEDSGHALGRGVKAVGLRWSTREAGRDRRPSQTQQGGRMGRPAGWKNPDEDQALIAARRGGAAVAPSAAAAVVGLAAAAAAAIGTGAFTASTMPNVRVISSAMTAFS